MTRVLHTPIKITILLKASFVVFAAFFTSTVLLFYSFLLRDFIPASNLRREYFICFGQIIFQGTLMLLFKSRIHLIGEYLYQMMSVSLVGGLLLLPVLVSSFLWFPLGPGPFYYLVYFGTVVLFMFFSHKKKVQKIGAPGWLSYTWVMYRLIVLTLILCTI